MIGTPRKLWFLLLPEQRRAAIWLLVLMLLGMVIETLSVGMLTPALEVMTQRDLAGQHPWIAPWLVRLGNPSQERLVLLGMAALVVVYAVKTVFLGWSGWVQARFVSRLQASLSQRLFAGYLRQPYTFHLQHNSAFLIRNAIGQVSGIASAVTQGLQLTTELCVMTGIAVMLLVVEPVGALVVMSVLGGAGWAFYRVTRSHLVRWGADFQRHEGRRIQHLQQGLGGVKDVKLLGREGEFLVQYGLHNTASARIGQRQSALQALPRLWLELLAVSGLGALVLVMIRQGRPVDSLLPVLGLFAAAAFRLMPSANRVLLALQSVRFSVPVIDTIYCEIRTVDGAAPTSGGSPLPLEETLRLDHLEFRYPGADAQSLRDVSLAIRRGSSVGFIGGSGAGKSTLVDLMLGLLTPDRGLVTVDGIDIQTRLRGWQDQIGYVPQTIYLTDDTLRRNVAFGLADDQIDEAAVWRTLRDAQLETFVRKLPEGLNTVVGERGVRLSGGQRQRIGIARALYHDPAVLVLDEATSSLDPHTERGVMAAVRALQGQKTLIIVAHRWSTVEQCDYLYRVEGGLVVDEGKTEAVLASRAVRGAHSA